MHGCLLGAVALAGLAASALVTGASADPLHFDTGTRWLQLPFSSVPPQNARFMFGDVNGDGAADLVFYNMARGEAYVSLSNKHGFAAPVLFATGLQVWNGTGDQPFSAVADVNGDGKADLIILSRGADNIPGAATAKVALSDGAHFTFPASPVWNGSWCANYQTCLFADLNGDRKADMLAYTPKAGTLWGSLSTGTAFGANAIWNNFFCMTNEVCAVGDVDGDGKADAILFKPRATAAGQKGNVLVARSTGAAFGPVRTAHGYFCIDQEICLVGDVNGDRKADIVLVKGAQTGQAAEVLVSLSNGTSFINANPFTWGHPPPLSPSVGGYGEFALADVTGTGRVALIQYGYAKRGTPTSSTAIGFAVDVYPVTDRSSSPTPTPTPGPPQPGGFSAVNVYNCHPSQNRMSFWLTDTTTGATSHTPPIDAMYSASGTCPDLQDSPQHFPLPAGHVTTIIAVDPDDIGCEGRDDPSILACRNNAANFTGAAAGGVCNWIVSAQAPACVR